MKTTRTGKNQAMLCLNHSYTGCVINSRKVKKFVLKEIMVWGNREFEGSSSSWPCLTADRVNIAQNVMENFAAETSTGSSNVHEVGRRAGIPEPSIWRILHGILDLHSYKIQDLYQILSADRYWCKTKLYCMYTWNVTHNVCWT